MELAWCLVAIVLSGCGRDEREIREWRASDHQVPRGADESGRAAPPETVEPQRPLTPEELEAREVQAAQALFGRECGPCHGPEGRGNGSSAPPGAAMPDFTSSEYQSSRTDEQIAAVLIQGQGMMPPFGERLTEQGIAAMTRHVRRFGSAAPREATGGAETSAPAAP